MNESTRPSAQYAYVRARQLEGTYSDDPSIGAWVVSAMRVARGWGMPTELEWPYDGRAQNWPPKEPVQIDLAAKVRRILAYQRVRTFDECRVVLSNKREVQVALQIVPDDWKSPPNGIIPMPSKDASPKASHSVVVVGYDDRKRLFIIRNSWGVGWGDGGYGYIPYVYFGRYQLEAWAVAVGGEAMNKRTGSKIKELMWGIPDCLALSPVRGFEIFDAGEDECTGWAFVVERQGFADIEEFFVRPNYRGKGYGRRLADLILESSHLSGRPLRLWASHADQSALHAVPSIKTLQRLHLSARPAKRQRWAFYVAT